MDLTAIIAAAVESAVADAVAAQLPGAPGNEPKPEPKPKTSTRKGSRGGSKPKPTARKPLPAACINALDAWMLLGADEKYRPRDEDAAANRPASPAQLQALNLSGKLSV